LTSLIHASGAVICHQRPERSFHVDDRQYAVCARCTGLYLSAAFGALAAWFGSGRMSRHARMILVVAALPTFVTMAAEWTGLAAGSNAVRAAAALPLGGAAGWLLVRMLRAENAASACIMIS
jgi:uncharacterized membrane protein